MKFTKSLQNRLDVLQNNIDEAKDELKRLRLVYSKFPDLEVSVYYNSPYGEETIYHSKSVNQLVTDFDYQIEREWGWKVSPYILLHEIKIHSTPPKFYLSHDNNKEFLQGHNIGAAVIEKLDALQSQRKE